jgi:hypothetical protein
MPVFSKVEGESVAKFTGATLSVYRKTVQVMSDVWDDYSVADVVTPEGVVKTVNADQGAKVDAPPALAAAVTRAKDAAARASRLMTVARKAQERVSEVDKGKVVEVVKKRAKGYGKKGVVFWIGETRYGTRVGMNVEGEADAFWTAITNLKVIENDPEQVAAAEEAEFEAEVAAAAACEAQAALAVLAADAEDKALRAAVVAGEGAEGWEAATAASVLACERAYAAAGRKAG